MRTPLPLLCLPLLVGSAIAAEQDGVLENPLIRYVISPQARNVVFIDRTTGTDYLRSNSPSPPAGLGRMLAHAIEPRR